MPTSYAVRRSISADPQTVWDLLTDPAGYPAWNPAVVSLDGRIAEGERIALVSVVDPKRTFRLTVSRLDPPNTMVWSDGMPLGLFRGVRTFTLTPAGTGTEFTMEEVFSGPMAPLITRFIPDMTDSFTQFGDGVKEAAERQGR